jgi:hypothetical protein
MSVDFQRITRRYISENRIPHENNELPKQYGELVSCGEAQPMFSSLGLGYWDIQGSKRGCRPSRGLESGNRTPAVQTSRLAYHMHF